MLSKFCKCFIIHLKYLPDQVYDGVVNVLLCLNHVLVKLLMQELLKLSSIIHEPIKVQLDILPGLAVRILNDSAYFKQAFDKEGEFAKVVHERMHQAKSTVIPMAYEAMTMEKAIHAL